MAGDAAFGARRHFVADANIGEGAPHHHLVIAAPGSIGIEVLDTHLAAHQVRPGGTSGHDRTGRRYVVGGDGIAEHRQQPRPFDIADRFRFPAHALEIRRQATIGGSFFPFIGEGRAGLHRAPLFVPLEDVAIALAEHFRG